MAGILTCIVTGTTWCFCSACSSLIGSCCGNDKPSTVAPGAASGRKRSVLLLILAIGIAFCLQYWVAPTIVGFNAPVDNVLSDAWLSGCQDLDSPEMIEKCAGNAGVYRSSFSAVIFFFLSGIAVTCKRTANREAWPAKYILFLFFVTGMCFVPNDPLFLSIHLNVARVGGAIFIVFQQIVFIDMAMNWNDGWVEKSNQAEVEEAGSGKKWLYAILVSAALLYLAAVIGWILLLIHFANCSTNMVFIVMTVILSISITAAQLSGEEGSLLASATISAYATMLCYSAVTKNDDEECNPYLGEEDFLSVIIGISLTIITLGYAGWSATADEKLSSRSNAGAIETSNTNTSSFEGDSTSQSNKKVTGVVLNDNDGTAEEEEAAAAASRKKELEAETTIPDNFSNSWKLNFMLASVSCWFAMALTGWGSIQTNGDVADPLVGQISMWIIVGSQWFILTIYLWTLVAPRLFPDRDFS